MERENFVAVILLAAFIGMWMWVLEAKAETTHSNEVMKSCLEESGYTPDKFETFDFSKPAACHSKWRVAETEKDYVKMRSFLQEHPWYKGKNWKWEERAEYSCEKIYSTRLLRNVEICSKPYYIN